MTRVCRTFAGALVLTLATAVPSWAASILVGDTITFELLDNGLGFPDPLTDTKLISAAGVGIVEDDGSNIGGSAGSGPMLDGESIRVFNTSVRFSLFGGDITNEVAPGFFATGYGPAARYVLSGLFDPGIAEITGVSIALSNVVNVALGTQVLFDAHSVTLYIDTLGIFAGSSNLGEVTLNLTVNELGPPAAVPEPGTIVLLGSGAAVVWWRRRRSQRQANGAY